MRRCTASIPCFPLGRWALSGLLTAWLLVVGSTVFAATAPTPSTSRTPNLSIPAQAVIFRLQQAALAAQ